MAVAKRVRLHPALQVSASSLAYYGPIPRAAPGLRSLHRGTGTTA